MGKTSIRFGHQNSDEFQTDTEDEEADKNPVLYHK